MFRTLIILLAIVIVFLIVKNRWQNRQRLKTDRSRSDSVETNKNTVRCQQCQLYLPADEAVVEDEMFFCCLQHQRDWHERSPD